MTLIERNKAIALFLSEAFMNDSVIVTRHIAGDVVTSETLTFVHPSHMTAAINTLKQLTRNLEKVRNEHIAGLN